jgi:NADH-quinone oxidoreductase subunit N
MTSHDCIALLPFLILAGASVLVMVAIAVHRSHLLTLLLTLAGLGASFISLWVADGLAPHQVTSLLLVDRYAVFYIGLIVAACFAVALLSYGYFEKCEGQREELYVLLLLAALGSAVLVASTHFASLFLGLEVLSVSLYALMAYLRDRRLPLEAGIKYLVLAASSAAFLLFGMALIYAELGTMDFAQIAARLSNVSELHLANLLAGTALLITGIGFKLGLVPFHLWTPDVYEGAPAPVTAFVATVSKGSVFALLLRFFYGSGWHLTSQLYLVFSIMAIASMLAGNLLALLQDNVKRILAYSSIAHLGYLLVAFLAGGELRVQAVTLYLVAYFITTLGAFGVVALLSTDERDADQLADYRGLFWKRPILAVMFTLMLLSLAGIPLTAGFVGKFYVVASGASSAKWTLVLTLVVGSVIGLFYYLRVVVAVFSEMPQVGETALRPSVAPLLLGSCTLVVLTLLLVWLGVYPSPWLDLIRRATISVGSPLGR